MGLFSLAWDAGSNFFFPFILVKALAHTLNIFCLVLFSPEFKGI
jgi:hypothetical protein